MYVDPIFLANTGTVSESLSTVTWIVAIFREWQ